MIVAIASGKVVQILPTGKGADGFAYHAGRNLAFVPAGQEGTLSIIAPDGKQAKIVQTLKTQVRARTIGLDERSGKMYLLPAQYGPAPARCGRPQMIPGSFVLLVGGQWCPVGRLAATALSSTAIRRRLAPTIPNSASGIAQAAGSGAAQLATGGMLVKLPRVTGSPPVPEQMSPPVFRIDRTSRDRR